VRFLNSVQGTGCQLYDKSKVTTDQSFDWFAKNNESEVNVGLYTIKPLTFKRLSYTIIEKELLSESYG